MNKATMILVTILQSLYNFAVVCIKYIFSLAAALYIQHFESISKYLAFTITVLVIDLVTGINAAKKRNELVTSLGLRRTTKKFIELGTAIVLARFFEVVYMPNLPLTFGVSIYISIHEMYSVYENISQTSGVNIINVLSKIIKRNSDDTK